VEVDKVKPQQWYIDVGRKLTEAIGGQIIVECDVFPSMIRFYLGDDSTWTIFTDAVSSWAIVLPSTEDTSIDEVKAEKQRLETGIELLVSSFVKRTGIVIDNISIQRKRPWGKEERYAVDVNVKLDKGDLP